MRTGSLHPLHDIDQSYRSQANLKGLLLTTRQTLIHPADDRLFLMIE